MGRPTGSKNGQGSTTKQAVGSKSLLSGRKSSGSTPKINGMGKGSEDGHDCYQSAFIDRSQTNFPFDIRINGFSSLWNTVKKANKKVQKLILDECDIILECRVCRNLFRSLPNFLAHKQTFCKNEFNPLADSGYSQFIQNSSTSYEFQYHLDQSLLDSFVRSGKESPKAAPFAPVSTRNPDLKDRGGVLKEAKVTRLHEILNRIAPEIENATRSPSSLYSDITMRENSQSRQNCGKEPQDVAGNDKVHILWEPLSRVPPLNGVIFQKTIGYDPSNCDVSSVQRDNRKIAEKDSAVLGPDGKIICVGNAQVVEEIVTKVIAQVEELHDEQQRLQTELKCTECLTLFPTRKTLRMHVRAAHRSTPDNEEEQLLQAIAESKLMCEQAAGDPSSDENSGDVCSSYPAFSSPPAKKLKSEDQSQLELERKDNNSLYSASALPESPKPDVDSTSSQRSALVEPPRPSPNVFTPVPKRPRGRPRKNSVVVKKDVAEAKEVNPEGRVVRSDSSDGSDTAQLNDQSNSISANLSKRQPRQSPRKYFGLTCPRCPEKFGTKTEMSSHFSHCNGVVSPANLPRPKSPHTKKISIQIRRDYVKPDSVSEVKNSSVGNNKTNLPTSYYLAKHASSSKFDWSHYERSTTTDNTSQQSSYQMNSVDGYNMYKGTKPSKDGRGPFDELNNCSNYHLHAGVDDEQEEYDEYEDTNGEPNSGSDTWGDDGLPDDDDVKISSHDVDVDTDKDSNVTDSGVSTTSVPPKNALPYRNLPCEPVPPGSSDSKHKGCGENSEDLIISSGNAIDAPCIEVDPVP